MDRIELARTISADPNRRSTRLVLITSSGQRGDARAARDAGVVAYPTKPIRQPDLHDVISRVMGGGDEPPSAQLVTHHSLQEERRARPRVLVVEDNPVNEAGRRAAAGEAGLRRGRRGQRAGGLGGCGSHPV